MIEWALFIVILALAVFAGWSIFLASVPITVAVMLGILILVCLVADSLLLNDIFNRFYGQQ